MDAIPKRRKHHVPSADIQESVKSLSNIELQEARQKIWDEIQGLDSKMDYYDADIERLESEHSDLLLRKYVSGLSKEDFESASAVLREALAHKNQEREDHLKSVGLLNASQDIVLSEISTRKFSRDIYENSILQDYAKLLIEDLKIRVAEAVRDLVVLAAWKSRMPLVGDCAVCPDAVVRDAMNKVFNDYHFYAGQYLADFEKEKRKEILAQIEGKPPVEDQK